MARDVLPDGLRAAGWGVDVVDAYRTRPVALTEAQADAVASADAVTFASSSSVTNLCATVGADRLPPTLISIGPVTSDAIRAQGLTVTAEADPHTIDALVVILGGIVRHGPRDLGQIVLSGLEQRQAGVGQRLCVECGQPVQNRRIKRQRV